MQLRHVTNIAPLCVNRSPNRCSFCASAKTFRRIAQGKGIRIPQSGKFSLMESESWVLESGLQLKESGIPLTIGIQNPSSTDKYWNPVSGIRNPRCGVHNPRLSWIPFYESGHSVNITLVNQHGRHSVDHPKMLHQKWFEHITL